MSQGQEVPAPRLFHVVSTSLQRSLHSIFCMYGDIETLILCRTAAGNAFVWKISETESNSACREHLVLTHLVYEQLDAIEKPEKTTSSSSYLPFFHESWSQSQQLLTIFALNFGKAKWVQPAKKGSLQVAKIIRKQVQVADPRSLCWNLVLSRLPGVFQLDDFFHENMSVNFHGSLELGISEKGTSKFFVGIHLKNQVHSFHNLLPLTTKNHRVHREKLFKNLNFKIPQLEFQSDATKKAVDVDQLISACDIFTFRAPKVNGGLEVTQHPR